MATKQASRKQAAKKGKAARQDAIAILKADHRRVEELFEKFDGLSERAHKTREATVETILEELSVHAGIEETVFYPAVRERLAAADEPMVLEALEEHHLVKLTLAELEQMTSRSERYAAKVTVLRELVKHHVDEEESELFRLVRSEFSKAELTDLGDELNAARSSAPTRPHPEAPDTPPANLVATVLAAPFDVATNVTKKAGAKVRDLVD